MNKKGYIQGRKGMKWMLTGTEVIKFLNILCCAVLILEAY